MQAYMRLHGIREYRRVIRNAAGLVKPEFMASMKVGATLIQSRAKSNFASQHTPYTGELVESIEVYPFVSAGSYIFGFVVGSNLPYAGVFEKRATWSRPPPPDPVKAWAMTKLGLSRNEATGFYINWIRKRMPHMITPTPYMRPAFDQSYPEIRVLMRRTLVRLFRA